MKSYVSPIIILKLGVFLSLSHVHIGCTRNVGQSQWASQWSVLFWLHWERYGEFQGKESITTFQNTLKILFVSNVNTSLRLIEQVLGESMAGISQHCKTGNVPAFGDCVGVASKALCGLTEAAGQVSFWPGSVWYCYQNALAALETLLQIQ